MNGKREVEIIIIIESSVYAIKIGRHCISSQRHACNPEHRTHVHKCV